MDRDCAATLTRVRYPVACVLVALGTHNLRAAQELLEPQPSASWAGQLLQGLEATKRAMASGSTGRWEPLDSVLESAFGPPLTTDFDRSASKEILSVITAGASVAGYEPAAYIASLLLKRAALFGGVDLDHVDSAKERNLDVLVLRRILARATVVDTTMASRVAADLLGVCQQDPRGKAELRAQAARWARYGT